MSANLVRDTNGHVMLHAGAELRHWTHDPFPAPLLLGGQKQAQRHGLKGTHSHLPTNRSRRAKALSSTTQRVRPGSARSPAVNTRTARLGGFGSHGVGGHVAAAVLAGEARGGGV